MTGVAVFAKGPSAPTKIAGWSCFAFCEKTREPSQETIEKVEELLDSTDYRSTGGRETPRNDYSVVTWHG